MADYGFVTGNLLSTSTSTFQVTFSSPQSGVIFISSSPIYVGLAGSFTFPSGATYYYFNNQQKWCISVDLSKYYVGVIVYNGSPPIDVTIQVDGQTLSMSSVMGTGVCGYATGIKMNNGLQIGALTCCSFDNVSTGATILPLGNACTCYGVYSCNGCPTSGSTSSLLCPVAPTKNEAFYVTLPTSIAPTKNEAFYVTLPTSIAPTKNEAFYVTLPTSIAPTKNEAFYVTLPTSTVSIGNEAFYVVQFKQTVTHITIPEYARFLSVAQAIYNVINLNVTASVNVSQLSFIPVEIQISPTVSVTIQQTSAPVTQTYEEQVFESFMALPMLYFLTKYTIRLIKRFRPRREKK